MKKILVDLRTIETNKVKIVFDAIGFSQHKRDLIFQFISFLEPPEYVKHIESCDFCKYEFNIDWITVKESANDQFSTISDQYGSEGLLKFCDDFLGIQRVNFHHIICPLFDIFFFSDYVNKTYEVKEEDLLALTLNQLQQYLKKQKILDLLFLSSELNIYSEIEQNIINILNQDYRVKVQTISELRNITDISHQTLITLIPNQIINIIDLFMPSSYCVYDHQNHIPTVNIIRYSQDKHLLTQKIRYSLSQLIHQMYHKKNDPKQYQYRSFAQIYDHYMGHVTYKDWTDFIIRQYTNLYEHEPCKILDIGCGTGTISDLLQEKGFDVYAFDQSSEMLDIASLKNHHVHFIQGDMSKVDFNSKFDLQVLLFDSINYLLEQDQIIQMLKMIKKNMSEKSLFIFDISTIYNSTEHFDGFINLEERSDYFFVHRADYHSSKRRQENYLNIFSERFLGYQREDEIHHQKVWKVSELINFVKESGLKVNGIYEINNPNNLLQINHNDLDHEYARLFFTVIK